MGIGHKASDACLLTKQGRQRGHRRPRHHSHLQMVTEGPISCCPITKLLPCSPPPWVCSCPTSVPPSAHEKERKQKVLRLHHCLHNSDNLHIYLVIFFLFWVLLQSILAGLVCATETCKEMQVVIPEMTDISLVWKSQGNRTSANQVVCLAAECTDLRGHVVMSQGQVKTLGSPGWPSCRLSFTFLTHWVSLTNGG